MSKNKRQVSDSLTERLTRKKSKDRGGGSRKYGRNRVKCAHYRAHRSHKNKLAKLRRHLADHLNDGCAIAALELAKKTI